MPSGRPKSYIQIEGIFETEVLGTFNIIRGFASLQELARISVPVFMHENDAGEVRGHQRQLDPQHAEDVKRYFEKGDQRFIPEVILSVRARWEREMHPENAQEQLGVKYDGAGLQVWRKHASRTLRIHRLRVSIAALDQIRAEQRIRRIDGNHRLALAEQLEIPVGFENKFKVPSCLLLLNEPGDAANDYTEALIFHTINSTAKALDSNHSLRLIFGQPAELTMPPQKEFDFSPVLHFTRLMKERLDAIPEPHRNRMGTRALSGLAVAARELHRAYPARTATREEVTRFADDIVAALTDLCTHLHPEFPDFCQADYFLELAAHVWMRKGGEGDHNQKALRCRSHLAEMAHWMGTDGLRGLVPEKPLGIQLLEIYDSVRSRVPKKVFLARWYPKDGEQKTRADNRLTALKTLVEGADLGLELVDMGTEEGGTDLIHPKMYEAIGSSEIVIADLTGLRPNVLIELGYALHHRHTKRLLLIFNAIAGADSVPFDTAGFRYEQIGEAADIPGKIKGHLEEILRKAKEGAI